MSRTRAAPGWIRDGFAAMWHEVRSYLATTWALVRAPAKFAAEWYEGTRTALNPLAMLATGATLVAATRQLAAAALGLPHPDSLVATIASALGPYAHYIAIGVVFHGLLAPLGRDRDVRIADSIAMALYAGAGPAAVAEAVGWLALSACAPFGVSPTMLGVMLGVAFSMFCYVLASSLGGLHRPSWLRMLLACVLVFPITGLVFGYLDPPGNYGLHWVLRLSPFQLTLGM